MYKQKFKEFNKQCSKELAGVIDEILKTENDKKVSAIGFITTDDFYGCYVSWDYEGCDVDEYYDWEQGLYPAFLYQPLVDVVDASKEIDFLQKNEEKWNFALSLLTVLEENIKQIPDEVFSENHYKREDILFFATMSDGDYVDEMLQESIKMFNTEETINKHEIDQ